jgi:adenine-specific DNA-methyltransferase
VPYDGSEVYLHWANKDQYYIKTTESFRQFSVDLAQARTGGEQLFTGNTPRKLHFTVVEAEEGAHNNVKAASDKERYFILDAGTPLAWADDELALRFHYRADPDKTGQAGKWREARNVKNAQGILDALAQQSQGTDAQAQLAQHFHQALAVEVPRGKSGDTQTLLAKYLNQFTARNSMDYFIHKDLGGFLKRELDFYIKNELFRLDDLGNADAPNPQQYDKLLKKALTLREVAHKLIVFLAQTEDFQKKLWLKKKFVVATQWLVTLDKVPASLYPQIEANDAQWAEWAALGFAAADAGRGELLKPESRLVLDTRFYDAAFTAQLLASIANLDDATDGVLVHSENFQALNLMHARYREQVKCIYIDPPYNTDGDGFCYKDKYRSSSWCSMMFDRLKKSKCLIRDNGTITSAIGREELLHLLELKDEVFGLQNRIADLVWEKGRKNDAKYFSLGHDYMLVYGKNTDVLKDQDAVWREEKPGSSEILAEYGRLKGIHGKDFAAIQEGIRTFYQSLDKDHSALKHRRYNRVDRNGLWRDDNISWPGGNGPRYDVIHPKTGLPCKVPDSGWRFANHAKFQLYLDHDFIEFRADHLDPPMLKRYLNYVLMDFDPDVKRRSTDSDEDSSNVQVMPSVFYKGQQPTVVAFRNLMGADVFRNPKEPSIIARLFGYMGDSQDIYLDYFAGSGTTGHAVINLNREDEGKRKYILIEMGDYFDTVLKPRIAKVVYSAAWKDGKSTLPESGISQLVKVIRLESYEDTLNNLLVAEESAQRKVIEANPALRERYFLHYLLELETRDSPSLLNISAFTDPTAYTLNIKKPSSDSQERRAVDLVETFTWLLGLRVSRLHAPQTFTADFTQEADPDLPGDTPQRMVLSGGLEEITLAAPVHPPECEGCKAWWFRAVQGVVQSKRTSGDGERVLVVWRKLTGNLEQDNLVLEAYLREALGFDVRRAHDAAPFDAVYVNGSHALPAMPLCEVRQLEEAFHHLMWDVQDA